MGAGQNDSGTMQARYTTESGSYYNTWLHLYRTSGTLSRFPMYDNIGSARGLLDATGAATDWYELDTFGRQVSSSGTTPNPYRFGAAWGYITDPSGMLQLGARFYWPEVGRFVGRDPAKAGVNWYAYGDNSPSAEIDPEGLVKVCGVWRDVTIPYMTGPFKKTVEFLWQKVGEGLSSSLGGVCECHWDRTAWLVEWYRWHRDYERTCIDTCTHKVSTEPRHEQGTYYHKLHQVPSIGPGGTTTTIGMTASGPKGWYCWCPQPGA